MSTGYISGFDGLPVLGFAEAPLIVSQPTVISSTSVTIFTNIANGGDAASSVRDLIVSKAKLTNKLTESLVKKYNSAFSELYKRTQQKVNELENELKYFRDPGRQATQVIDFVPRDAVVDDEAKDLIMQALLEGKSLADVMGEEDILC